MVANRMMGLFFLLSGMLILATGILWVLRIAGADWVPGNIRAIINTPVGVGPVPAGLEWFFLFLGLLLIFFGGAIVRREPWALLPGVVLTAVLTLFIFIFSVELLLWRMDSNPGVSRPEFFNDWGYYIITALFLMVVLFGYATRRLQSDENRNLYALRFSNMPPVARTCNKCGRYLAEYGCPVHDRPPLNAVLVRTDTMERFPIREEKVTLGRDRSNALAFEPLPNRNQEYKSISRKQATIIQEGGYFFIINESNDNPIFVDDRPLGVPSGQNSSEPVPLVNGTTLRLGRVYFTFYSDAAILDAALAQSQQHGPIQPIQPTGSQIGHQMGRT
jgi:hypothetical protein